MRDDLHLIGSRQRQLCTEPCSTGGTRQKMKKGVFAADYKDEGALDGASKKRKRRLLADEEWMASDEVVASCKKLNSGGGRSPKPCWTPSPPLGCARTAWNEDDYDLADSDGGEL